MDNLEDYREHDAVKTLPFIQQNCLFSRHQAGLDASVGILCENPDDLNKVLAKLLEAVLLREASNEYTYNSAKTGSNVLRALSRTGAAFVGEFSRAGSLNRDTFSKLSKDIIPTIPPIIPAHTNRPSLILRENAC